MTKERKNRVFVIEHLEPELAKWSLIEYKNISKIAGKNNLYFTNIKNTRDARKLGGLGRVFRESVASLRLKSVCVLDPEAMRTLKPREAGKFSYFIFGGILGDYPPRKRTERELTKRIVYKSEKRNIGKEQMSTDNAVYTVREISRGKPIGKLKFKDTISIKINKILTLELPYRYNLVNGKPLISRELVRFIKKKESS